MQILQHSALNIPFLSVLNVFHSQALTHNSRLRGRGRSNIALSKMAVPHAIHVTGCQLVTFSGVPV